MNKVWTAYEYCVLSLLLQVILFPFFPPQLVWGLLFSLSLSSFHLAFRSLLVHICASDEKKMKKNLSGGAPVNAIYIFVLIVTYRPLFLLRPLFISQWNRLMCQALCSCYGIISVTSIPMCRVLFDCYYCCCRPFTVAVIVLSVLLSWQWYLLQYVKCYLNIGTTQRLLSQRNLILCVRKC